MKSKVEKRWEELRNMFKTSAQQSTQHFTEEQMQHVCQECWSTGIPMAVYGDKAISATFVPFSAPFPDEESGGERTIEAAVLYETRIIRDGNGWKSQQYLIEVCDSLPMLAQACMQTTFYALTLHPSSDGEDLCKYADLLRYVGLHGEAIRWYQLSNIAGFNWGAYNIAEYYRNGIYVKQDFAEAIRWYQRSAQLGSHEASLRLEELAMLQV